MSRLAKAALSGALQWSLGRRNVVRLGRFLSNEARLDFNNDMSRNGELMVQRAVLARHPSSEPLHVIDVGGNVGDWSAHLLSAAKDAGRASVELYVFEPAPGAFAALERRFASPPAGARVELVAAAASIAEGEAQLHLVAESAGVNSLHDRDDVTEIGAVTVRLTTLDRFCGERDIPHIALVKCDTEGHDAEVIQGARALLEAGRIDVMQFEYNWRWIHSRHYLRDVFEFAQPLSYRIGKVTPKGVEFYPAWHQELETFREGNYLLCSERSVGWFAPITWWNE